MYSLPSGSHTLIKSISNSISIEDSRPIGGNDSLGAFCGIEDDGEWVVTSEDEGIT